MVSNTTSICIGLVCHDRWKGRRFRFNFFGITGLVVRDLEICIVHILPRSFPAKFKDHDSKSDNKAINAIHKKNVVKTFQTNQSPSTLQDTKMRSLQFKFAEKKSMFLFLVLIVLSTSLRRLGPIHVAAFRTSGFLPKISISIEGDIQRFNRFQCSTRACASNVLLEWNRRFAFPLLASLSDSEGDDLPHDDTTKAFVDYMFREMGCQGEPGDVQVQMDEVTRRRGLFVTAENGIAEGDYVFAIPTTSAWVVEQLEGNLETKELSDAEKGLLFWKWQQDEDFDNWKPYKDVLPTKTEAFDPTPDFWSDEQIQALELPSMVEGALSKKKSVQVAANENNDLSEDDLRFASWLVSSRAITVLQMSDDIEEDEIETEEMEDDNDDDDFDDLATTCAMVPLLDMINHSSDSPNAYFAVLGDDGDENDTGDDEESLFYSVVADRDLKQGEELLISYGSEQDSSVDLLLQYGFVPKSNPFDVEFWEDFFEETENEEISFWTTTLQEDEDRLSQLGNASENIIERTILEFRIRMKRAYDDWKSLSD